MTLTLYIDMMSQPSRAIWLFCLENNIPHQLHLIQIAKNQQRSREFLAINPMGKVPAIDDDGFKLFESHAILAYLADSRGVADHWYPKDHKARANVDRMLHWHHANLRFGSARLVFNTVLAPRLGLPSDQSAVKEAQSVLKNSLKFMENILSQQQYIAGKEISIADLSLACELAQLSMLPYDLSSFANVVAWYKRVEALPNYKKVNEVLNKVVSKSSSSSSESKVKAVPTAGQEQRILLSAAVFDEIMKRLPEEGEAMVKQLGSVFRFTITGKTADGSTVTESWLVDMKNGKGSVKFGDKETKADCTFILTDEVFIDLAAGKLNPQMAFMSRKMKIQGNLAKALKFDQVVLKKRANEIKEVLKTLIPSKL